MPLRALFLVEKSLTENFPMYYIGVKNGKLRNNTWPSTRCIQNLKSLAQIGAEKSVTECFVREKENGQIKRLIRYIWLFLSYTVQLVITKLYTKFQNPSSSSSLLAL